jgi:hypothetical protein
MSNEAPAPLSTTVPDWLPPTGGVQSVPCGRDFDAVRVSSFDGIRAIGRLGSRACPMIEDRATGVVYWLLPVGSAHGWRLRDVEVLGDGYDVAVPPVSGPDDGSVRWLVPPPGDGSCLADPQRLREALTGLDDEPPRAPFHLPPHLRLPLRMRKQVMCHYCQGEIFEGDEAAHAEECPDRPRPRG